MAVISCLQTAVRADNIVIQGEANRASRKDRSPAMTIAQTLITLAHSDDAHIDNIFGQAPADLTLDRLAKRISALLNQYRTAGDTPAVTSATDTHAVVTFEDGSAITSAGSGYSINWEVV